MSFAMEKTAKRPTFGVMTENATWRTMPMGWSGRRFSVSWLGRTPDTHKGSKARLGQ